MLTSKECINCMLLYDSDTFIPLVSGLFTLLKNCIFFRGGGGGFSHKDSNHVIKTFKEILS